MMYALLTKQADGSFDLPVVWRGTSIKSLNNFFDVTLTGGFFRHPVTAADRAQFGVFPVSAAQKPVGMIHTAAPDTFDGVTVQENVTSVPDPAYVAPDPLADTLAAQITTVKTEAGRRIVEIIPEYKQRNLTAQAAILAEKGRANWTADELAAWDAGEAVWTVVAGIRTKSGEIETLLGSMTLDELREFDVRDDLNWI